MNSDQNKPGKPKHYAKISTKRRKQLIDLVIGKDYSIGRAAQRLKLKLSTAKMIVKKFRDHGTLFEKKFQSKLNQKTKEQRKKINKEFVEHQNKESQLIEVKIEEDECKVKVEPISPVANQLPFVCGDQGVDMRGWHGGLFHPLPSYNGFMGSLSYPIMYPFKH